MSTALPLDEVQVKLFELVSRVAGQHERITITVHGRTSAVLMSVGIQVMPKRSSSMPYIGDPQADGPSVVPTVRISSLVPEGTHSSNTAHLSTRSAARLAMSRQPGLTGDPGRR
jgi:prevent-host-death family protein